MEPGSVRIITGPVRAGKSTRMIHMASQASYDLGVVCFLPKIAVRKKPGEGADTDSSSIERVGFIETHDGNEYPAQLINVEHPFDLENRLREIERESGKWHDVIGIDEAQMFCRRSAMLDVIRHLVLDGREVLVAGLDRDFRGRPFGMMATLIPQVSRQRITRLKAICTECGAPAGFSQRIINDIPVTHDSPTIMVGGVELYEPRCGRCFARNHTNGTVSKDKHAELIC